MQDKVAAVAVKGLFQRSQQRKRHLLQDKRLLRRGHDGADDEEDHEQKPDRKPWPFLPSAVAPPNSTTTKKPDTSTADDNKERSIKRCRINADSIDSTYLQANPLHQVPTMDDRKRFRWITADSTLQVTKDLSSLNSRLPRANPVIKQLIDSALVKRLGRIRRLDDEEKAVGGGVVLNREASSVGPPALRFQPTPNLPLTYDQVSQCLGREGGRMVDALLDILLSTWGERACGLAKVDQDYHAFLQHAARPPAEFSKRSDALEDVTTGPSRVSVYRRQGQRDIRLGDWKDMVEVLEGHVERSTRQAMAKWSKKGGAAGSVKEEGVIGQKGRPAAAAYSYMEGGPIMSKDRLARVQARLQAIFLDAINMRHPDEEGGKRKRKRRYRPKQQETVPPPLMQEEDLEK